MPIANYTTSVSVERTVNEITKMLCAAGAMATMTEYEGGLPKSVAFRLKSGDNSLHFRLPANWRGVQQVLKKTKGVTQRHCEDDQARRIAWRIVRDWLRAQLALTAAGCADIEQIFLPYMLDGETDTTLYEKVKERKFQLTLPSSK